ncbi:hypothetical protein [Bradyrhizobium cytisi]|uniref:Uncharacterized protein n=1 Tax=Bradyrhizobium cytisi TaxID=515489 RepID=A0A5S4W228_9BRAD|nr:hypothetical protein [Bradyrhizobium cytisi]TYL71384.1 hypothetical protein FXB38_40220 [Bradyrhizobium cytisi]
MPRQPFLPSHSKADLIYGIGHISKKPKIAEATGRCIMAWSYVDWQMAVLLAALIKANSEASVAIFLTLRNARAQRDVLVAAAEMTLAESDREIFDAIMLIYASLQTQRADIAHGIFGSIPDGKEDEIPWIETKNLSKDWIERFHKPKKEDSPKQQDEKLAQKCCTYIYKLADLERLEAEIVQLWGVAFTFTSYLNHPGLPVAVEALKKQCADSPLMTQALERMRKSKE